MEGYLLIRMNQMWLAFGFLIVTPLVLQWHELLVIFV
jgi:hypothetical protein